MRLYNPFYPPKKPFFNRIMLELGYEKDGKFYERGTSDGRTSTLTACDCTDQSIEELRLAGTCRSVHHCTEYDVAFARGHANGNGDSDGTGIT